MVLRDWVQALQAPLFVAVLSPALLGTAVALHEGHPFLPVGFLLTLAALMLIQAAINLQKGYFEGRGAPDAGVPMTSLFAFDAGALRRLPWTPKTTYLLSLALLAAAGALGFYLDTVTRGHVILILGAVGVVLGFTYSAPPIQMSYRGLGEVNTFLAFGPLAVLGTHYVQANQLSTTAFLVSVPMGLFTASVSTSRYFLTVEEDRRKGKGDPVVRFGPRAGEGLLLGLLCGAEAAVGVFVILGFLTPSFLVFYATLPLALAIPFLAGSTDPRRVLRAVKLTILLDLLGGILLATPFSLPV